MELIEQMEQIENSKMINLNVISIITLNVNDLKKILIKRQRLSDWMESKTQHTLHTKTQNL